MNVNMRLNDNAGIADGVPRSFIKASQQRQWQGHEAA